MEVKGFLGGEVGSGPGSRAGVWIEGRTSAACYIWAGTNLTKNWRVLVMLFLACGGRAHSAGTEGTHPGWEDCMLKQSPRGCVEFY